MKEAEPSFHCLSLLKRAMIVRLEGPDDIIERVVFHQPPPRRFRARFYMGRRTPGLAISTSHGPVILHRDVFAALKAAKLTGWKAIPVEIGGPGDREWPGYSVLWITGKSGPADPSRSVPRTVEKPGGSFREHYGFFFELDSWDGSDFFIPEGTTITGLTNRAREVLAGFKEIAPSLEVLADFPDYTRPSRMLRRSEQARKWATESKAAMDKARRKGKPQK
jgi:hypothetical protein